MLPAVIALIGLLVIANALMTGAVLTKSGTFEQVIVHYGSQPAGRGGRSNPSHTTSELRLIDGSAYWFDRDNFTPQVGGSPIDSGEAGHRVDVWYTLALLPPFHPARVALQTYDVQRAKCRGQSQPNRQRTPTRIQGTRATSR
jgi:hypothetical protein